MEKMMGGGLLVLLLLAGVAEAAPFGSIKCATGTPLPKKYVQVVNGGPPAEVVPHVGADQSIYYVVDAATLPQALGVKIDVKAVNDFGESAVTTYIVDIGAPAKPGAMEWRTTKP